MDLQRAKQDPGSLFQDPTQILELEVTNEDKIAILKQWDYDTRELMVAEEENMTQDNNKPNSANIDLGELLRNIHKALLTLQPDDGQTENVSSPTKQG